MERQQPPAYPEAPLDPPFNKPGRKEHQVKEFFERGEHDRKSRRYDWTCRYCGSTLAKAKVEALHKHITVRCELAPQEAKEKALQLRASAPPAAVPPAAVPPGASPAANAPKQRQQQAAGSGQLRPLHTYRDHNLMLLRWMVVQDVPFHVVDDVSFQAYVKAISSGRSTPADATQLAALLREDHAALDGAQLAALPAVNITLNVHARSSSSSSAPRQYACAAVTPERAVHVVSLEELPAAAAAAHAELNISDYFYRQCQRVGLRRVAAFTTDGSAQMAEARHLLQLRPDCQHMLALPCMAEGLARLFHAAVSHPRAAAVVASAQQLVTVCNRSPDLLGFLAQCAQQAGAAGCRLRPCGAAAARVTSIHACLASVLRMEGAFERLLQQHAVLGCPQALVAEVARLEQLSSRAFWLQLEALCRVLEPLARTVEAVLAGGGVTMAEMTRYWAYLAATYHALLPTLGALDADYVEHLMLTYTEGLRALPLELCRLALFLDPRYRDAACGRALPTFTAIVQLACTIQDHRGHSVEDVKHLVAQLQAYKAALPPFNAEFAAARSASGGGGGSSGGGGTAATVRAWWGALNSAPTAMIVNLAVLLVDVVPHAANIEGVFGMQALFKRAAAAASAAPAAPAEERGASADLTRLHYKEMLSASAAAGAAAAAAASARPLKRTRTDDFIAGAVEYAAPAAAAAAAAAASKAQHTDEAAALITAGAAAPLDLAELVEALHAVYATDTQRCRGAPPAAAAAPGPAAALARGGGGAQDAAALQQLSLLLAPWQAADINVHNPALNPFGAAAHAAPAVPLGGMGAGGSSGIDVAALVAAELAKTV